MPDFRQLYGYTRDREGVRVREIPGVSPGMVTMLLGHTAFLKLANIGFVLLPYKEERLPIPLDERLADGLKQIDAVRDDAAKLAREGKPGLLGQFRVDGLLSGRGNPDRHRQGGPGDCSYAVDSVLGSNDELLDEPLAKDQALQNRVNATN